MGAALPDSSICGTPAEDTPALRGDHGDIGKRSVQCADRSDKQQDQAIHPYGIWFQKHWQYD